MAFTGKEDHSITLEEASKLTRNYRESVGKDAIRASFFGKETLQKIFEQEGCVGIRIYYGKEDNDKAQLVLVGVNSKNEDLIQGTIAEKGIPCPPVCPDSSPLIK